MDRDFHVMSPRGFSALMLGEDLFTLRNLAALALVSGGIAIANYVREGKDGAKQA